MSAPGRWCSLKEWGEDRVEDRVDDCVEDRIDDGVEGRV
ncbi:MAG: hypothetical protein RL492_1586, partial [Verrucomicrobiota bacterium]